MVTKHTDREMRQKVALESHLAGGRGNVSVDGSSSCWVERLIGVAL